MDLISVLPVILAVLAFATGYLIRLHQDKLSENERVRRNLEELHRRLVEFSHRLRDAWYDLSVADDPDCRRKRAEEVRVLIRESMPMISHLQQVHANSLGEKGSELH